MSVDDGQDESALERGERLEWDAIEAFEMKTGKIVDRVGFVESDENEFIGCSPDGLIMNDGIYDEAVEVKCLSSANHLKAVIENEVPKDYYPQVIQSFIVNENLKTLYFVLYDPRVSIYPIHIITVDREEVQQDIEDYRKQEIEFVEIVNQKIGEIVKI